jgi:hypothetical protein
MERSSIKLTTCLSLADAEQVDVCVNILQKLMMDEKARSKFEMLCPLFKCMILSEHHQSKSLTGIDALSACPIVLYDESSLEEASDQDYFFISLSLTIAIDWIYEIINGFILDLSDDVLYHASIVTENDFSLQFTLSQRLSHLLDLKGKLCEITPLAETSASKLELSNKCSVRLHFCFII